MYIKWIVCDVKKDKIQEFSLAQEKWIKTTSADGFIAQTGGWNLKNKTEACIISFWDSKEHLDYFMRDLHDKIFDKNKQNEAYNSIVVSHFNGKLSLKGKSTSLTNTIQISRFLRVSDCYLNPGKSEYFEKVQKEIWVSEMQNSKGMLNGVVSKEPKNNLRCLVSTFWESVENHNYYDDRILLNYLKKTGTGNDIRKIKAMY